MKTDMEQLRELVNQLQVENEQLRTAVAAPVALLATTSSQEGPTALTINSPGNTESAAPVPRAVSTITERFVCVPRERKCPMFRGGLALAL